jgi:hypothetical protein
MRRILVRESMYLRRTLSTSVHYPSLLTQIYSIPTTHTQLQYTENTRHTQTSSIILLYKVIATFSSPNILSILLISDTQLMSTLKNTAHKYSNFIEKLEDRMVLNNTKTQFDYVPQDF